MSFIRGALITILGAVLFLSLFLLNTTLTLSWSMEYEALQPSIISVSDSLLTQYNLTQIIEENKGLIDLYCLEQENLYINEQGIELNIPCTILTSDTDTILNYTLTQLIDQIYYQEYNCTLLQCIQQEEKPLVLVSEKAQNFWQVKSYWLMLISLIILILMILIAKNKATPFFISGIMTIITAIPFSKIGPILNNSENPIVALISIFFSKSPSVFWTMLIVGIILILIGTAIKFLGLGAKITKIFTKKESEPETISKKDVKQIVKKEVEKQNKPKQKQPQKIKQKQTSKKQENNALPTKKELEEVLGKKKK